jgi:hypothetical protein
MRPGKKVMAAILMWSAVSSGALAATDEPILTPRQSAKASNDIPKEPPPPSVTVIGAYDARGILGRDVKSTADENMGRIVDVIVDRSGTVRAAVIDFGGFLGVGSRKIAVDWNAMRFTSLSRITIDMTREQLKAAPEYETGKPITVLGASLESALSRVTARMPER